jgi:BirA family biotin operon repressor/biotin-[acetyl-CoA-carboxylase] ligase
MKRPALLPFLPLDKMWQITESDVASSSGDLAFERIDADGATAHGAVFIVAEQTKGRGRQGRNWTSQKGDGLYLSAIIKPERAVSDWPILSFAASLSLYQAVIALYPELSAKIYLKWPNDLVTDSHKLAGILLEARGQHLVIGCGVNLKNAPDIENKGLRAGDLSRYLEGRTVDRLALGYRFLDELSIQLASFEAEGITPIIDRWSKYSKMTGKTVSITTRNSQIDGYCEGVDERGSLRVLDKAGRHHLITTGDVHIMADER